MERHPRPVSTWERETRERAPRNQPFQPLTLRGERGEVACRYYALPGARAGAVWAGATDDWDTPARGLYPRLCSWLQDEGIASLRIRLRRPRDLAQCVADVRTGIHYLAGQGISRLALIGHGRGGAAVMQAAIGLRAARAVVALAPVGVAGPIERLGPRCSLLLLHGADDRVLPWSAVRPIYERAREPKDVLLYSGAGHSLDEAADAVCDRVHDWVVEELIP